MLLVDMTGRTGAGSPEQIGAITANVGVTLGSTVTVNVEVVAHWPAVGVKL